MENVRTIHRPLLVLILLPDSNVESSNMASLGIGFRYCYFRHRGSRNCSRFQNSPPAKSRRKTDQNWRLANKPRCKTGNFPFHAVPTLRPQSIAGRSRRHLAWTPEIWRSVIWEGKKCLLPPKVPVTDAPLRSEAMQPGPCPPATPAMPQAWEQLRRSTSRFR